MTDQNLPSTLAAPQSSPLPEMIWVQGGSFQMGSGNNSSEQPIHEVSVKDFYLGKFPVTNFQYAAFLKSYGSDEVKRGKDKGQKMVYEHHWGLTQNLGIWQSAIGFEDHPVINVTWYGAAAYCQWLTHETGKQYRLPSEAEWEYAARGGVHWKDGFTYAGGNKLKEVGWYDANSHDETMPVGLKLPNQLGLYDMSGNVDEWCADHWHENYGGAPKNGRPWTKGGDSSHRVVRGGSCIDYGSYCWVSYRFRDSTYFRDGNLGFRLARY